MKMLRGGGGTEMFSGIKGGARKVLDILKGGGYKLFKVLVQQGPGVFTGGVAQLYRKSRGRDRIDLDKRVRKFHLFEIRSVQDELRKWKGNFVP